MTGEGRFRTRSGSSFGRSVLLRITAPVWVPFYLLAGLCGLCTDGLLFQVEGWLGRPLRVGIPGRVALALPSLALFPILSTCEVSGLFLLSAGRWPLFLAFDGMLVAATGISMGIVGDALLVRGPLTGALFAAVMVTWLTFTNVMRIGAWALKTATMLAVAGVTGVALALGTRAPDIGLPPVTFYLVIPAAVLGGALLVSVGIVVWRRRFSRALFETWEPSSAVGNGAALVRGTLAVALLPGWFPVLALSWLFDRIFRRLMLPDVDQRLGSGIGTLAIANRFSSFVGLRYMKGKRDQRFVSLITVLSILAVTMGVWTLTVVLSVMSGFEVDLRDKILGTNSHAVVLNYVGTFSDYRDAMDVINGVDNVKACTPFVYTELMVKHHDHVTGAIFKGVDIETVGGVTDLVDSLDLGPDGPLQTHEEKMALLRAIDAPIPRPEGRVIEDPEAGLPGILIGEEMAMVLRATVGDVVLVTSPFGEPGPFGTMVTTMQKFRVKGIFYSGMYEYDTKFMYVSIPAAQAFLKFGDEVTGIEIAVRDIYAADDVSDELERQLGYPFWSRDWMAMNRNLFQALKLEKVVMAVILSFIYVGAALNIIVVLIMVVMEKQKEIAILRAMGSTKIQLMKAFMIEGLIIGFVGTTIGTILGYVTCFALDRFRFIPLDTDVYYLDTLPVAMSAWTFVGVAAFAITVSFLATLYPSWYATELDPVEGLRYE